VTGFFEVIRTSAPHIYHSALTLSPRTSLVRELYISRARPFARIAHGLPTSYPCITTEKASSSLGAAVWSPCSKFIAVAWDSGVQTTIEVRDAVTLQQLSSLEPQPGEARWLIFSPDSHSLTWLGGRPEAFISWDLRTGVQLSTILPEPGRTPGKYFSPTYSECGTMLGVLCFRAEDSTICIYNVLSGTHIHAHRVGRVFGRKVWTHGECIRYATFASGSIIIWEFGFTSGHEPTQVESLFIPGDFDPPEGLSLHPTLFRFAFVDRETVLVWDSRQSRFLLNSNDVENPMEMSFSLDGRFFTCGTRGREIYLWRESPAGYLLHRKLESNYGYPHSHISPDGELIIGRSVSGIQVWRTTDPATSLSSILTQTPPRTGTCMVEFSPGEMFAAIARLQDNVVTIFDLESGDPRLVIDAGMEVHGLRVGRSTIVVVGAGKIITWDLPTVTSTLNTRADVNDGARTVTFAQPPLSQFQRAPPLSISPDLHRMAIMGEVNDYSTGLTEHSLHLFDVSTGQRIARACTWMGRTPWFALGGREVWCDAGSGIAEGWSIVEDNESGATGLERIRITTDPPEGFPWTSSRGYEVTDDGWVLSSSGKRLLWLPPYPRSAKRRAWSGRFLALLRPVLPEPVLVELPAE
jgi:WD40 repeat protein